MVGGMRGWKVCCLGMGVKCVAKVCNVGVFGLVLEGGGDGGV